MGVVYTAQDPRRDRQVTIKVLPPDLTWWQARYNPATSFMALTPGTRLGHYDVTSLLGEGGMGQVWQATDTQLNRPVALKILPDAFADDPDRIARFQREAQVLASLNHPNIAAIYGIEEDEAEGTRALVLELVEGPTLADRISKGPIPLDAALAIAKQIAEALEAAHEAGVIHRDLKPANIKVRDDGTVKVLDFGLAKAFETGTPDPNQSRSPTVSLTAAATQIGMVIGTVAYMAPEQARGLPVDKRADIWAFGAVLFEMLTGTRPFAGSDASETLARVIDREPDWTALPDNTPPILAGFLRQCLEKNPKRRVRDIGDVGLAMAGAFASSVRPAGGDAHAAHRLRVWQRPAAAVSMALALMAVAAAASWSVTRPAPSAVSRFDMNVPDDERLDANARGRHALAISPDGRFVAYVTVPGLSIRELAQETAVALPNTLGAVEPFFSPDSRWLGFFADGEMRKVSTSGGSPVRIAEVPAEPWGVTWGPDDNILYSRGVGGIWRVAGTGGTPELLFEAKDGEQLHQPQLLPGGEHVLFTVRDLNSIWPLARVVAQSISTGERTVLVDRGMDGRYLPSGHLVYALGDSVLAVAFGVDPPRVLGAAVPVVNPVRMTSTETGSAQFTVSSEGTLVYVTRTDAESRLVWVNRQGQETPIDVPVGTYRRVRVAPDGSKLVMERHGSRTEIWVHDLNRGSQTPLTLGAESGTWPEWTPDGQRVVWNSGTGLAWRASDGSGQTESLVEGPLLTPYGWSADGRTLVVNESSPTADILTVDVDGDRTVQPLLATEFGEFRPAVSPDGRWIAYSSNESVPGQIFVRPFPNVEDGRHLVSVDGGISPVWSPDGSELFYRNRDAMIAVSVQTEPEFSVGTPTVLFRGGYAGGVAGPEGRLYDLAPDGARFVMIDTGGTTTDSFRVVLNWDQELLERVPVP